MSIIQPTWIRFHAGFMLTKELHDSLIKVCADRLWGKLFFTDKSTLTDFGVVLRILKTDWLSYRSMFTRHAVQLCHLLRWAIHWSCSFRFLQSRHQYLRNVNRCPVIDSWSVAKTVSFSIRASKILRPRRLRKLRLESEFAFFQSLSRLILLI